MTAAGFKSLILSRATAALPVFPHFQINPINASPAYRYTGK